MFKVGDVVEWDCEHDRGVYGLKKGDLITITELVEEWYILRFSFNGIGRFTCRFNDVKIVEEEN